MLEHLFRNCANNSADEHCVDHQDVDPVSVFTWQGLGGALLKLFLTRVPGCHEVCCTITLWQGIEQA